MDRSILQNMAFYFVVALIVIISVFPFYYAVITSFETGTAIFKPNVLPEAFSLSNYETVFSQRSFLRSVVNSVFIASVTVLCALLLAVTASFALARVQFRGRGLLLITILGVSMFPC
jgi:trehalose/maltose transport system permease protein